MYSNLIRQQFSQELNYNDKALFNTYQAILHADEGNIHDSISVFEKIDYLDTNDQSVQRFIDLMFGLTL